LDWCFVYITNVASSEIYPTWPESALRANIYVITTFALNRIYTEYYRVQGLLFDITSSTSYDQAFVYERDIFANISALVDEQFGDYITRTGHVEPMFSSYCNGTTAKCRGLSQWGTYSLAQQDYTPYRMLQQYYGNDVVIRRNTPVGIVPPSYPGRLLRRGDAGESVRTVQKMLRRIARNYPAIPLVEISPVGVLDSETDIAVHAFQRGMGIIADGVVGRTTWNRMVSIFNAVKRLNELDSEGVTLAEAETVFSSNLRLGDTGTDVKIVQSYLNFIALFYSDLNPVEVNGAFDQNTDAAVREFQRIAELPSDGVVGRYTINRLLESYTELYNTLPPEKQQPYYPNYAFSQGDVGSDVRFLQTMLNDLEQFEGRAGLAVDGVYGKATENAVRAFQQQMRLPVSGDVGILTWNALAQQYNQ
jgi:peptidoglycan hydrolase-like protein with peptidoglycan-binding domain